MTDTTYNGWSNYATWIINLEICDDLITFLSANISDGEMDPFDSESDLAAQLQNDVYEIVSAYGELDDEPRAELALSYARAFLDDVNWHEIAESAVTDNPELIRS